MQIIKEKEREKEIIEFIESEIDNFKQGIYKNSKELQKSGKENLIKGLANLPDLERTVYKLELITNNIFNYLDLETDLNIAIREAKTPKNIAGSVSSKPVMPLEIDQKRLDMLLENAIPDRGILRDYVNVFSEVTDCPKAFLFWGAMVMVATILGKNMYIKYILQKRFALIFGVCF